MVYELHDYQRLAVSFLQERRRAALFLDMGLGKTAAALSALQEENLPVLVTAPKRVAENVWSSEVALWRPDLKVITVSGSRVRRAKLLAEPADVYVIGRDNLADAVPLADQYNTFIIDELSGFKNRASRRWKFARQICRSEPDYIWGLTGTPTPNGLLDLWAQVYLLDVGERLGKTLTGYRNRYFSPGRQLPNGIITEWILRPESEQNIHEKLEDIALSMGTEGRVNLPSVTHNVVDVPLLTPTWKLYKDLKKNLVADMDMFGGGVITTPTAAALSNKLSQLSAGFLYDQDELGNPLETYRIVHHEKVRAVQEIVDGTGSPVLVLYRFRAEREMLLEAFRENAHTIDEPGVLDRWDRGEIPILLAHPASAGHGLNLQHGGFTAVWTTLPWSLEEWKQSNKRLVRQGQKHPVIIHILNSPRTIDSSIRLALDGKATVEDALLNHLESPL